MAFLTEKISGKNHYLHRITTIGSSPQNNIRLRGENVASEHARILFIKDRFSIEACNKSYAVLINDKGVKKTELSEGDIIKIGEIEFIFSIFAVASRTDPDLSKADVLKKMNAFSLTLMSAQDLPGLLETLMDSIMEITCADKGFLILTEEGEFKIKTSRNIDGTDLTECDELSRTLVNKISATRKSVLISDAADDTEFSGSKSIINLKLKSIMGLPLILENELLGLIYVGSAKISNLFDSEDLEVATIFASQAALILKNIILLGNLKTENRNLREIVGDAVIYQSASMENIMRMVQRIAPSDINVLITGETGTGKELIAKEIHKQSLRKDMPFITVNCSAIPENLIESELFGHKKGSFTGAVIDKKGKFQAADRGTIFLDEIGDAPKQVQIKMLRVIETGEIETVGEAHPKKVDVRIIAATHKNLKSDDFREDLFYRLAGVEIALPPLSQRGMDSLYIARSILEKFSIAKNRSLKMTKTAEAVLMKYSWPGNIRELKNRLLRAAMLCQSNDISEKDLELGQGAETKILPLNEAKENFAKTYINEILAINMGNKSKAALDLGVDPRTIYRYLLDTEEK